MIGRENEVGKVKRILAWTEASNIRPAPTPNSVCGIELCETVHFHMPDFRFELTADGFDKFATLVRQAHAKWVALGRPPEAEFISLAVGKIGDTVYPHRFEIEEQDIIPSTHIHFRGLSIRQTIDEFKNLAHVVEEAHRKLDDE